MNNCVSCGEPSEVVQINDDIYVRCEDCNSYSQGFPAHWDSVGGMTIGATDQAIFSWNKTNSLPED